MSIDLRQNHPHPAQRHRVQEGIVVEPVGGTGDDRVRRAGRQRVEQPHVLSDADSGGATVAVGIDAIALAQCHRHQSVRAHERRQGPRGAQRVAYPRRPFRGEIALRHQNVRLVDGAPPVDEIAESLAGATGKGGQRSGGAGPVPSALRRNPERQGEMIEGDDRRDARGPQAREHLAIAGSGRRVPDAGRWLEAAPFDAQAVGVGAEALQLGEIAAPIIPGVGGARGRGAVRDVRTSVRVGALFPVRPVVVIAAFDLIGGGGSAQQKARGRSFEHAVLGNRRGIEGDGLAATDAGGGCTGQRERASDPQAARCRRLAF